MRIHRDINRLPNFRQAVVTIGSFDGVHLGHRKIIEKMKRLANAVGGESVLITFYPHPRQVVFPADPFEMLSTPEEKEWLLARTGIDHLVIVPFTIAFSQLSADDYIENFLVKWFRPTFIVIGHDHRFGLSRMGDVRFLKWHGSKFGYHVVELEKQVTDQVTVSSTKIRKALRGGDVRQAYRLGGDPYLLTGKVVHGDKMGKKLGFPTANLVIAEKNKLIPLDGIYAVKVYLGEELLDGMLYIGSRPSLEGKNTHRIEVNIFDFSRDIYNWEIRLSLIEFLRKDQRHHTLESLSAVIADDKLHAQAVLAQEVTKEYIPPHPEIAIVILNYNGKDMLAKYLPQIIQHKPDHARVIVADNKSTDDSLAFLAAHFFDKVEVIPLDKNLGYAGGYNQALKQVETDYFILLNSDVAVSENWIDPLIACMEADSSVAACQPKILSMTTPDCFEYAGAAGGWLDILGYPFCRGRIMSQVEKDEGQYNQTDEIFWASGAALSIRAPVFRQLGGFDPDYFAHMEEIDLCWKIKRAGFKIMAVPSSTVYHLGGGTLQYESPRKIFLNFRNSLYTLLKNEPYHQLVWKIPLRFVLDTLVSLLFFLTKDLDSAWAIGRAHVSFYKNLGKMFRKRTEEGQRIRNLKSRESRANKGRYQRLMTVDYYLLGKRKFSEIIPDEKGN